MATRSFEDKQDEETRYRVDSDFAASVRASAAATGVAAAAAVVTADEIIAEAAKRFDDAPLVGLVQSISNQNIAVAERLSTILHIIRHPPPLPNSQDSFVTTTNLPSSSSSSSRPTSSHNNPPPQTFSLTAVDITTTAPSSPPPAASDLKDTLRPRRVTDVVFPDISLYSIPPLPASMSPKVLLSAFLPSSSSAVQEDASAAAIVSQAFWWFFADAFSYQPKAQEILFDAMSANFVRIFSQNALAKTSDTVITTVTLAMSQAVVAAFILAFPDSAEAAGGGGGGAIKLREKVTRSLMFWATGCGMSAASTEDAFGASFLSRVKTCKDALTLSENLLRPADHAAGGSGRLRNNVAGNGRLIRKILDPQPPQNARLQPPPDGAHLNAHCKTSIDRLEILFTKELSTTTPHPSSRSSSPTPPHNAHAPNVRKSDAEPLVPRPPPLPPSTKRSIRPSNVPMLLLPPPVNIDAPSQQAANFTSHSSHRPRVATSSDMNTAETQSHRDALLSRLPFSLVQNSAFVARWLTTNGISGVMAPNGIVGMSHRAKEIERHYAVEGHQSARRASQAVKEYSVKAAETHRRITSLRVKSNLQQAAIDQAYAALKRLPRSATHKFASTLVAEMNALIED